MMSPSSRRAFSLIELSIVLVILGLLTGGILSGQSLIRASEMRATSVEYQRYTSAVFSFRQKYFALPGDFNNATSFWGAAHANAVTCGTTVGTGTATCNGDANNRVNDGCTDATCTTLTAPAASNEALRFWQQLSNAGLIEGSYTGVAENDYDEATRNNAPSSKIPQGLWAVWYLGTSSGGEVAGSQLIFDGAYGNALTLGAPADSTPPMLPLFSPEEVWNIDKKMDDGMPSSGKLLPVNPGYGLWSVCSDATSSAGLNAGGELAAYNLSDDTVQCSLIMRNLF